MDFDPKRDLFDESLVDDDWVLHHLFSRIIFDSLLKDIVHGHYRVENPMHVTLHITDDDAVLFVWEADRALVFQNEEVVIDWALGFVLEDVFETDPDSVSEIYMDTTVGDLAPFLFIRAGDEVLYSSGAAGRKGRRLM